MGKRGVDNVNVEGVGTGDDSNYQRSVAASRRYAELVTVEAEAEEERFYRAAMEVVAEWRLARLPREQAAASTGSRLERLQADERLLELELDLVGAHGPTLPTADRPWDGIRRQSELRVLDQAIGRVRRDRRRAQLAHSSLRLLTLGLWGLLKRLRFARQRQSHQRAFPFGRAR